MARISAAPSKDEMAALVQALKSHAHDPLWRDRAVCAQTDPEAFFPEKGSSNEAAMSVCRACPVRIDCLSYAIGSDTAEHGIWGGTTARHRTTIRKDMRMPAPQSIEKARRDHRIVELYLSGFDPMSIATEVGVTDRTVYRAVRSHRIAVAKDEDAAPEDLTG